MRRGLNVSAVGLVWILWGCGGRAAPHGVGASADNTAATTTVPAQPTPGASPSTPATDGGAVVAPPGSEAPGDVADPAGGALGTDPAAGAVTDGVPALGGCRMLPADNPWNADISGLALHANSDTLIDSIGRNTGLHADFGTEWLGAPLGIPFEVVDASQALVGVSFDVEDESDAGPYPIPPDVAIEGGPDSGGDRHVLVLESGSCTLYELFGARPQADGSWQASSGAVFDLTSNALRPDRYTSADAAGLPILPGLVRYDEVVERAEILHALRFTVGSSQSAYIGPATHAASNSSDADLPPMGLRLRMRADYDCAGLSSEVQVICTSLKRYGMFVADNGSDWFLSGAHDPRWNDGNLADLGEIPGDAFEVVDTGPTVPY